MHIKYVGPFDRVEVDGRVVAQGESFDVLAAVAGRAPSGDDPGEGLLAQPDNWQPAKAPKADKADKDAES